MKAHDITNLTTKLNSSDNFGTEIKVIASLVIFVGVATGSTYGKK